MKYKYPFDRKFRIKIHDDWWQMYIVTEEEAVELDVICNDSTDGFRALTYTSEKCMFVVETYISKDIIAHELFHVYVKYFHMTSAEITVSQFEEVVADFLEENLDKFVKMRNKLYNRFRKLEERYR